MESTANQSANSLGTVIATAAIAFGIGYLAANSVSNDTALQYTCDNEEMDTTTRYLSGGNRDRILAALERYEQNDFVSHGLIQL